MATTPTLEGLMAMRHRDVLDVHGDKVGELVEVYFDKATRVPEWLGVDTSPFGSKRVLAPAVGARIDERGVCIAWGKDAVLDTPEVLDREISQDLEQHLYDHYGLQYSFEGSPTGLPRDVRAQIPASGSEPPATQRSLPDASPEEGALRWPDIPRDDPIHTTVVDAPGEPATRGGSGASGIARESRLETAVDDTEADGRLYLAGAVAAVAGSVVATMRGWRWPEMALRAAALAMLSLGIMRKRREVAQHEARRAAEPAPPHRSLKQRVLSTIGR
ncbi:MAG: PRC-barrel domain-containing protein [Dehalococcoidia bacterium]|nr:PRC-barrel domain-containing protein [Dehalococcoidia bacterium]